MASLRSRGPGRRSALIVLTVLLLVLIALGLLSFEGQPPPIPSTVARGLVTHAMLSYYQRFDIPRGAGGQWAADVPGFRAKTANKVAAVHEKALRAHWTGWKLSDLLSGVGRTSLQKSAMPICCAAVWDVHVTGVWRVGNSIFVNATEHSRISLPVRRSFTWTRRGPTIRWNDSSHRESVQLTFIRQRRAFLATNFTTSWATGPCC